MFKNEFSNENHWQQNNGIIYVQHALHRHVMILMFDFYIPYTGAVIWRMWGLADGYRRGCQMGICLHEQQLTV